MFIYVLGKTDINNFIEAQPAWCVQKDWIRLKTKINGEKKKFQKLVKQRENALNL
jgi:hypothetical protein